MTTLIIVVAILLVVGIIAMTICNASCKSTEPVSKKPTKNTCSASTAQPEVKTCVSTEPKNVCLPSTEKAKPVTKKKETTKKTTTTKKSTTVAKKKPATTTKKKTTSSTTKKSTASKK